MPLDEVVRLVKEKDPANRVHAALYDMYLRDGAEKPAYAEFDEKFEQELKDRGLDNSTIEEIVESVSDQMLVDAEYEEDPEEFAKEFIKKEEWAPPTEGVQDGFSPVDGFVRNTAGQMFLTDQTTEVFPHTGYPGLAVYFDREDRLYQKGQPFTPFVPVDGFVRDTAGQMFLTDRTTEVFPHDGYPDQAVYYDRQNRLYQHGQPYVPVVPETVNLASSEEIKELFNDDSNYEEFTKAVADGDLAIEYSDEDISSFDADLFANVE